MFYGIETKICGVTITVDGTDLHYEAHSHQQVAEILSGQLKTLWTMNDCATDEYGRPVYKHRIDNFVIHHFIQPDSVFEKWVNEQELSH